MERRRGRAGRHVAFGLTFHSELPLRETLSAPEAGQGSGEQENIVSIRLGVMDNLPPEVFSEGQATCLSPQLAYLHWEKVGLFRLQHGCDVTIQPAPHASEDRLRQLLLGPAMALLLHQRGDLVLHGSAVAFAHAKRGATIFLGESGAGKSTLAAALHAVGHRMITDDLASVRFGARGPTLYPAHPSNKLHPDSAECITRSAETLKPLSEGDARRVYSSRRNFNPSPLGVERICLLEWGSDIQLQQMAPRDAILPLFRHAYCSTLFQSADKKRHFDQLSQLLRSASVYRLIRPRNFLVLPALVERLAL